MRELIDNKVGQFRPVYYGQFKPEWTVTSKPERGGQRNRILHSDTFIQTIASNICVYDA